MKLSTAIRKGIKLDGKQVRRKVFELNKAGEIIGCCAMGAAAIGQFGLRRMRQVVANAWAWNDEHKPSAICDLGEWTIDAFDKVRAPSAKRAKLVNVGVPEKCFAFDDPSEAIDLYSLVAELNDRLRWSRERIADALAAAGL